MPTPQTVDHVDVAAYVLGILDEPDEAAFVRHFTRCPRCRREYRELSDLPALLDQLRPARPAGRRSHAPALPGKRVLGQALDRVAATRRARIRTLWLAAAAVIVLLVAVPLIVLRSVDTGGQVAAQSTPTNSPAPTTPSTTSTIATGTDVVAGARTVKGDNPGAGLSVIIGIEPQPWGTKINLELRSTTGPMPCELAAVSRSGDVQILLSWQVPAGGVGLSNSSEPLRLEGGAGFTPDDIDRFELRRTDGGPNLLTIPV